MLSEKSHYKVTPNYNAPVFRSPQGWSFSECHRSHAGVPALLFLLM